MDTLHVDARDRGGAAKMAALETAALAVRRMHTHAHQVMHIHDMRTSGHDMRMLHLSRQA
eukprot:3892715-Pleurochrysis_carterae.AAC.1